MEMCEGGTLFDLLHRHREKRLNDEQILYILRHLIAGIVHMHSQRPAVAHRDIKVENILLHEKVFKFCDFGSASTDVVDLGAVSK
jgi:AP2-associated kinase